MATNLETTARLDRALRSFGPHWYATVMGTGILAVVIVSLPSGWPGAAIPATGFWLLALALLVVVTAATSLHHRHHPEVARGHLDHPAMAHFYGAPAMALMTVGAGALLVGVNVVGSGAALALDAVLWTAGTLLGLATTFVVPRRVWGRHGASPSGSWLMPVVPPMVSATTGALLVPHLPAGDARVALLLACYACFGVSVVASVLVIPIVLRRVLRHGIGPVAAVPTLWILLGPLGQSVTAVDHLGALAPGVLRAPFGDLAASLAWVYGIPVLAGALALLAVLAVATARVRPPFSMTWWSFTFPVGTVVTGTSAMTSLTGSRVLAAVAVVLAAFLVGAWCVVANRTVRGAWSGRLFQPAA